MAANWCASPLMTKGRPRIVYEPMYRLRLLGGQYYFTTGNGSVSGNIMAVAAPGIMLNRRWSLFPVLSGSYKGTKDVQDLVGAGTVFQEQMDYRAGLKGVYKLEEDPRWRVKPSGSYTIQYLKETKDEGWGSGLFDYRKLDFGIETEFLYKKPFSLRAGFDYFLTRFPNYTSLESQAATSFQNQSLARELVGDSVLDVNGQAFNIAGDLPLGRVAAEGSYLFMHQGFPSQPLVDSSGQLTSEHRDDTTHMLSGRLIYPWQIRQGLRLTGSVGLGVVQNTSDQNNYDASHAVFTERFYDYTEHRRSVGFRLSAGDPKERPVVAGLDMSLNTRTYARRRIQDAAGTYLGDNLRTNTFALSASASRPIAPRFKALFTIQHVVSSSNQEYEQLYQYSYSATNYLFGVSYDY